MRDGSNASSLAVVVRGLVLGLVGVAVLIPLVQALIVIPLRSSRTLEANEIAAIQSLREIYSAEIEYQKNYPGKGFACSLSALGGTTTYGPPSSQSAHLLHGYLAAGQKSGYSFSIDNCTRVSLNHQHTYTDYEVTAIPQTFGKTGKRGFCIDQRGEVQVDPAGGGVCSEALK